MEFHNERAGELTVTTGEKMLTPQDWEAMYKAQEEDLRVLRRAVREAIKAVAGQTDDAVSNAFLSLLPAEVGAIKHKLTKTTAERDALAGQVLELRGALGKRDAQIDHLFRHSGRQGSEDYDALEVSAAWARLRSPMPALSIPLPAAAERVKVEREYCDAALADFADTGSSHAARYDAAWAALRAARGGR